MATRQEELRRLMKESKEKTQAKHATRPHVAGKSVGTANGSVAAVHASNGVSQGSKPSATTETSTMKTSIPAGFFDDSLADAKARNVDIKQVAEKQLAQDWEQFQEFVAEIEEQEEKELEIHQEETQEREAVEQLENMEYVDRYRIVLERAAKLGSKGTTKKRDAPTAGEASSSATTIVAGTSTNGSSSVDVEDEGATEQVVATAFQKRIKKKRRVAKSESSEDEENDFDPCNWRSKGL